MNLGLDTRVREVIDNFIAQSVLPNVCPFFLKYSRNVSRTFGAVHSCVSSAMVRGDWKRAEPQSLND